MGQGCNKTKYEGQSIKIASPPPTLRFEVEGDRRPPFPFLSSDSRLLPILSLGVLPYRLSNLCSSAAYPNLHASRRYMPSVIATYSPLISTIILPISTIGQIFRCSLCRSPSLPRDPSEDGSAKVYDHIH
ncbi:hypothetical protein Cni_G22130 [Canna indica]|uniref:Uncharacterized protein n=1 Tax=Canna indica TaxID=4628 RepID=A0AAQ3KRC5_9LILI|nr:hypothetical protein Cni_G22130 [Canna indica]